MTFYLVSWLAVSFACPWGIGQAPTIVKELLCSKSQDIQFKLYSKEDLAQKKLEELGSGVTSRLVLINGGRANAVVVNWKPELE